MLQQTAFINSQRNPQTLQTPGWLIPVVCHPVPYLISVHGSWVNHGCQRKVHGIKGKYSNIATTIQALPTSLWAYHCYSIWSNSVKIIISSAFHHNCRCSIFVVNNRQSIDKSQVVVCECAGLS